MLVLLQNKKMIFRYIIIYYEIW